VHAFIKSMSLVMEWEKSSLYLPNYFVVFGCLDVVEGGVRTHGEKVETCV
jgi:hypothetical protein